MHAHTYPCDYRILLSIFTVPTIFVEVHGGLKHQPQLLLVLHTVVKELSTVS